MHVKEVLACLLACLPILLKLFISIALAAATVIVADIRLQHLWGPMWTEDGQLSENLPSPWIGSLGTNQLYGQLLVTSLPRVQKVIVLPNDLIISFYDMYAFYLYFNFRESYTEKTEIRHVQLGGVPMTYTGGLVKGRRETAVPTLCLLRSLTGPCSFSDVIHHDVIQL